MILWWQSQGLKHKIISTRIAFKAHDDIVFIIFACFCFLLNLKHFWRQFSGLIHNAVILSRSIQSISFVKLIRNESKLPWGAHSVLIFQKLIINDPWRRHSIQPPLPNRPPSSWWHWAWGTLVRCHITAAHWLKSVCLKQNKYVKSFVVLPPKPTETLLYG